MTADRWGDDQLFEEAVQLTRAQIALRDNEAPPPARAGEARKRRIDSMQTEIAQCADFVADLDRYASHAAKAQLVGNVVGPFMARYLKDLRASTVAHGQRLRDDLAFLRGRG